jgi:riboflavin synthase
VFTGIVEEVGEVVEASETGLLIRGPLVTADAHLGDSICINGTCLTVTALNGDTFRVDTVPETRRRTNLGNLAAGSVVNLERALPANGRLGGHFVQGHIEGVGEIASLTREREAWLVQISTPPELLRFIVEKGFITVDGISLTVVSCDASGFVVTIIPYTYEHTNLRGRRVGDKVNLETDVLAKYVEQLLSREQSGGVPGTDASPGRK